MLYINTVKEKGHTVISLDTGKPKNKFQHSFMTKILSKLGRELYQPDKKYFLEIYSKH